MDMLPSRNENRSTALHLASEDGQVEIAKLLIDHGHGADIDNRDNKQYTPLVLASHFGYLEVVRLLIESGAALFARDQYRST